MLMASNEETINDLLNNYKLSSELSYKTRNETIGHISVISADDIKRLQAYKLSDVLKSIKMFNYMDNIYGVHNLSLLTATNSVSSAVRMYINDHEVSSVYTLSPFLVWDDLPLDFVSHIEVYYGEGSLSLGHESGTTIIKIYTKQPSKENGGFLRNSISFNNEYQTSIMYGLNTFNEWSYMVFANTSQLKHKDYIDGQQVSKNKDNEYAYINIQKENFNIDFGYGYTKKDPFVSLATDIKPDNGYTYSQDYYLNLTKVFDDGVKCNIGFDQNEREFELSNNEGIMMLPVINPSNMFTIATTMPKYYQEDLTFKKYYASLSKEFSVDNHKFLAALTYKQKTYDTNSRSYIGMVFNNPSSTNKELLSSLSKEEVSSVMLEDLYRLNESNYLIANARFDYYQRDGGYKNLKEKMFRVGHIWEMNENFGTKAFISHTYFAPSFYNIDFASKAKTNNGRELQSEPVKYYSLEAILADDTNRLSAMYIHLEIDKYFTIDDTSYGFYNSNDMVVGDGLLIEYEKTFENSDKFYINYGIVNSSLGVYSSKNSLAMRYLGTFEEFDYFGELIYKSGYKLQRIDIKDGYDVNIGATYNISKDLSLSLKGENIFAKGIKIPYKNYATGEYKALKNNSPKTILTMKWNF
jgi:iron complex outermembrane receptor protein